MTPLALRTVAPIDPATTDVKLISLWLRRFESPHTRRGYQRYVSGLLAATGKGLRQTTLEDVQMFLEGIGGASVRAAAVRAIKSLFQFADTLGLLTFNVAGAVRLPNVREQLAKRILP